MNQKVTYPKGNAMAAVVELVENQEEQEDLKYLYPLETAPIQKMVSEVCDQMEYDGSIMYDRYPDKVTVERMTDSICCERNQSCDESCKNPWMKTLTGVMLCHEMKCRREKRCSHKKRLQGED